MYNNHDYSRFYQPSIVDPMSGIPPYNEIPPIGTPPLGTPSYNGCPAGYRSVPVEVKPINVNLTVNSMGFYCFQRTSI